MTLAYWLNARLWGRFAWLPNSGWGLAAVILAATLAATVPVRLFVGPYTWFSLGGPLAFQSSRLLLYLAWFLLGIALGSADLQRSLAAKNLRPWPIWLALGLATFVAHWFLSGGPWLRPLPPWLDHTALATVFALCCTFTGLASLGLARFLVRAPWSLAGSLSANAYGIYILHYPFVTWTQYTLLSHQWPAALKFALTFSVALAASWLATASLRRTVARRVL